MWGWTWQATWPVNLLIIVQRHNCSAPYLHVNVQDVYQSIWIPWNTKLSACLEAVIQKAESKQRGGDFPLCEIDGVILSPLFADTCGWKGSKFWKRLEADATKSWHRNAHNPVCSQNILCRSLTPSGKNSVLGVRRWEHHISQSWRWRGCRRTPACHLCHRPIHHLPQIHFGSHVTRGFFF